MGTFGLIPSALVIFAALQTTQKLSDLKQKLIFIYQSSVGSDWAWLGDFTFKSLRVAAIVLESSKDSGLNVHDGSFTGMRVYSVPG